MKLSDPNVMKLIELALDEDIKGGDITTESIISNGLTAEAIIKVKQDGIVAGLDVAKVILEKFDAAAVWNLKKSDGDFCNKGEIVAYIRARNSALLTSERTILNILQRMSGVATRTNKFVRKLEGLETKVLDTRKTAPGHRVLDKYAVKMGGGENHRMGLYDMVLIKDNHIKIAGGVKEAVKTAKDKIKDHIQIEVEASNLQQVKEALESEVDIIMLDNMNVDEVKEAVKLCNGKVKTEVSGNIGIENIREMAETGVDFISVGELTHSVSALDISMKIVA